ncbi:DUF3862 domain-containing protein [Vagococcus sp.]|uniref:DUF3862 domain-containing protein n=1 Tax=Vagococcus sp. TaxID=1933889 RepID=UPI003F9549CE
MAKKHITGKDGKKYVMREKKPFYKKWWFWLIVVIVVGAIGSQLGDGDKKETNQTNSISTAQTDATSSNPKEVSKEENNESSNDLLADFNNIQIGDIMDNGNGGTSMADIKSKFGEPSSTSETNIEGHKAELATWTGLKGAGMVSALSVSFSNDSAVSKNITGLKTEKREKVTLEQVNNVKTDGSFTKEQAIREFGEPDSISISNVGGDTIEMLSWSKNVNGDIGANFNISFTNDKATTKSNISMK